MLHDKFSSGVTRKIFLCLSLLLTMTFLISSLCYAGTNVPMYKTKVKWDLKPNKSYTVKSKYYYVGLQNQDIKIYNYKKTSLKNKYKISFDLLYDETVFRPTSSQVHQMIQGMNYYNDNVIGGWCNTYIVDYFSGKSLECDDYSNNLPYADVSVSSRRVLRYGKQTYYDNDGCYVWLQKEKWHYTITYPKSYKRLCIGIGGYPLLWSNTTTDKFDYGIYPFAYLKEYKILPDNFHFMRIR